METITEKNASKNESLKLRTKYINSSEMMLGEEIFGKAYYPHSSTYLKKSRLLNDIVTSFYFLRSPLLEMNPAELLKRLFITLTSPQINRLNRKRHFYLGNKELNYLISDYNNSSLNERTVEIPIALDFLMQKNPAEILEVGNVLNHYVDVQHDVVDKYEKELDVINEDAAYFRTDKRYDLVISISTIEHIGYDEDKKEYGKALRTIRNLKSLLSPGGKILITVPLGYNPEIDSIVKNHSEEFSDIHFLKRMSIMNHWKEVTVEEALNTRYGDKYFCANAIAILTHVSE